jgi:uncharacterized protein
VASPFHDGEQAVQERLGVRERVENMGQRLVRDVMPDQHREFFGDLPFLIVSSRDDTGALWASLLTGVAGFVRSPTARRLLVTASPLPGDPLAQNLRVGAPLGALGIELPTRRRNRANGRLRSVAAGGFELEVEQSFGNCKQYIQARAGEFTPAERVAPPTIELAALSPEALAILSRSDTTFLATGSREPERGHTQGLDVSHRGGLPGFIRAVATPAGTRLTLPDYYGNFMFNSFGNLEVNPRAGLLVLDFEGGRVLSLTGEARVLWTSAALPDFPGAERLLEFDVKGGFSWQAVLRGWSPPEYARELRP